MLIRDEKAPWIRLFLELYNSQNRSPAGVSYLDNVQFVLRNHQTYVPWGIQIQPVSRCFLQLTEKFPSHYWITSPFDRESFHNDRDDILPAFVRTAIELAQTSAYNPDWFMVEGGCFGFRIQDGELHMLVTMTAASIELQNTAMVADLIWGLMNALLLATGKELDFGTLTFRIGRVYMTEHERGYVATLRHLPNDPHYGEWLRFEHFTPNDASALLSGREGDTSPVLQWIRRNA